MIYLRTSIITYFCISVAATITVYAFGLEEHTYSYSGSGSTLTNTGNTYYYTLAGRLIGKLSGVSTLSTNFLLTDLLGSVVSTISNTAGSAQLLWNQLYGPYGEKRYSAGTVDTAKGFTGQYSDDLTGLDYYVARYYDPVIGRFLSADTKEDNFSGFDPYAYVLGNPETDTDPTGQLNYAAGSGMAWAPGSTTTYYWGQPYASQQSSSSSIDLSLPPQPQTTNGRPRSHTTSGSSHTPVKSSSTKAPSKPAHKPDPVKAQKAAIDANATLGHWAQGLTALTVLLGAGATITFAIAAAGLGAGLAGFLATCAATCLAAVNLVELGAAAGLLLAEANDLAVEFTRQSNLLGLANPPSRGDLDASFNYIQGEIDNSVGASIGSAVGGLITMPFSGGATTGLALGGVLGMVVNAAFQATVDQAQHDEYQALFG